MTNPVMDVLLAGVGLVVWVLICKVANVFTPRRDAPAVIDPCAESRAAAHELRASLAGDPR